MGKKTNEEILDSILKECYQHRNKSKKPVFAYLVLRTDILWIINRRGRGLTPKEISSECTSNRMFNQLLKLEKYEAVKKTIERNRLLFFIEASFIYIFDIMMIAMLFPSLPPWFRAFAVVLVLPLLCILRRIAFELPAWMTLAAFALSQRTNRNLDCISSIVEMQSRRKEIQQCKKDLRSTSITRIAERRITLRHQIKGKSLKDQLIEIVQYLQEKKEIMSDCIPFLGCSLWDSSDAIAFLKTLSCFKEFCLQQATYEIKIKNLTGIEIKPNWYSLAIEIFGKEPFSFLERIEHSSGQVFFILPGGKRASPRILWNEIIRYKETDLESILSVKVLMKILRKKSFDAYSNINDNSLCFTRVQLQKGKCAAVNEKKERPPSKKLTAIVEKINSESAPR